MQKHLSSKEIYQGSIFKLTKDEVLIQDCIYERDVIHHHGGVGVLAINDHKVLLVKQYRFAIKKDTYEVPAGKLEENEDPYTCGLRELEEESGYTSETLQTICAMYSTPGFCNEKIYLYWTNDLLKVEHPKPMDEDEEIETIWVDLKDVSSMLEDGTIEDAKTIIALQFALLHNL